MNKITELKQKRAGLIDKQRDLVDKADEEERGLTSEEKTKFEKVGEDIDNLEERIEQRQEILEREKKEIGRQVESDDRNQEPENKEYREAFEQYMRYGKKNMDGDAAKLLREHRAQNVANNTKGGYLIIPEWENRIIDKLTNISVMRQIATVETTSSELNIPISTTKPTFGWIDETGSFPETDEELGNKSVDAWKTGGIIKVSEEFLYDNDYDFEGRIKRDAAIGFDDIEEPGYISGDNVKKPRGFLLDADVGVNASASGSIDADEVMDLRYALSSGYRKNANWLMNDNTVKAIRKLKDGNDQYLWQPGLQKGQPDMLLGHSIKFSDSMPDIGTGEKPIAFGDFSYYGIYDRRGMFMQRLVEKYADTGQVGFRTYKRTDGLLTLSETVQVIEMA